MSASTSSRPTDASDAVAPEFESPETLRVMIAFDDEPACRRALRLLVRVLSRAGEGLDLCPMAWCFDFFDAPDCRARASLDAADADIVIVSASHAGAPSAAVQAWIGSCYTGRRKPAALLVALLGMPGEAAGAHRAFLDFLHHVATEAGVAFLAPDDPVRENPASTAAHTPAFVA